MAFDASAFIAQARVGSLAGSVRSVPAAGVAGTADAVTLAITGGPALADGLTLSFLPEAANTGGVTINYNSGGAVELLDGAGEALVADALSATGPVIVQYSSGAAKWRLLSGGGAIIATGSTLARTLADRAGDTINVLDFCADAALVAAIKARTTTSSDCAAIDTAIEAALTASAAGDSIVFPDGLYCTTSTKYITKNYIKVFFQGARIEHYGDTDCIVVRSTSHATSPDGPEGVEIHDAFITRGDQATTLVKGISLVCCDRPQIINPRVYHFPIRIQIAGGSYPHISNPQFRNSGPGLSFQNYIAGSRLIGFVAHYYNAGADIRHCYQPMLQGMGCDGVNVDYGIYMEDADGLQFNGGSFAVFKTAQICSKLDNDRSTVNVVNMSDVYMDGGVTPHFTPNNILIDGTNRPTVEGGYWTITNCFIGNDTGGVGETGDGIPITVERPTIMTFVNGRSSSCDRALMSVTGEAGGHYKFIGWDFENLNTGESDDAALIFDSVETVKFIGCDFKGIPSTVVKLLDTEAAIESARGVGNTFIDCGDEIDITGTTVNEYVWGDAGGSLPADATFEPVIKVGSTSATMDAAASGVEVSYLTADVVFVRGRVKATSWSGTGAVTIDSILPGNVAGAIMCAKVDVYDGFLATINGEFYAGEDLLYLTNELTGATLTHAALDGSIIDFSFSAVVKLA